MRGVHGAHISKSTSQAGSKTTVNIKVSSGNQSVKASATVKK